MCQSCDWEDMLQECDELLSDPDFEFAEDTIQGIREWVEENKHITPKQVLALGNIRDCK